MTDKLRPVAWEITSHNGAEFMDWQEVDIYVNRDQPT